MIYTFLTGLIILLGKLRDRFHKTRFVRFDRTLPLVKEHRPYLYISCCDCGLTHFFIPDHSGTPLRPQNYQYKFRFGAKGWTEPNIGLGQEAVEHAIKFGLIHRKDLILEGSEIVFKK